MRSLIHYWHWKTDDEMIKRLNWYARWFLPMGRPLDAQTSLSAGLPPVILRPHSNVTAMLIVCLIVRLAMMLLEEWICNNCLIPRVPGGDSKKTVWVVHQPWRINTITLSCKTLHHPHERPGSPGFIIVLDFENALVKDFSYIHSFSVKEGIT